MSRVCQERPYIYHCLFSLPWGTGNLRPLLLLPTVAISCSSQAPVPFCGRELGMYAARLNHFPSTAVLDDNSYGNCFSCLAQLSSCKK